MTLPTILLFPPFPPQKKQIPAPIHTHPSGHKKFIHRSCHVRINLLYTALFSTPTRHRHLIARAIGRARLSLYPRAKSRRRAGGRKRSFIDYRLYLFPGAGYHELYNGVVCNDTILATGVFSSKELWMLSKGTTTSVTLHCSLSLSLSLSLYLSLSHTLSLFSHCPFFVYVSFVMPVVMVFLLGWPFLTFF